MTQPETSHVNLSQPASQNAILQKAFEGRHDLLKSIPSVPAILQSLLAEVSQAPEKVDLNRVAELIARDKSIAAQCLRLANSPLFGRGNRTDSVRGAVRTLGIAHIRDIAFSTMMMQVSGAQKGLDPVVFWEHSLGCAIVSRKLARGWIRRSREGLSGWTAARSGLHRQYGAVSSAGKSCARECIKDR